jgi:hypothetical protein
MLVCLALRKSFFYRKQGEIKVMRSLLIIFVLSILKVTDVCASSHHCLGIVPQNNLWISTTNKNRSQVTVADFNSLIAKLSTIYSPMAQSHNASLNIVGNWEDGTVNAFAWQDPDGEKWNIDIYGGFARHPLMTVDAFAMVICHELGHHFGGAPKKGWFWERHRWASAEGQADYYATLKCGRYFFRDDDNEAVLKNKDVPLILKERCAKNFTSLSDQYLCQRVAMAGRELSYVLTDIMEGHINISFDTPDPTIVEMTNLEYPTGQCRLDSFFQGSLCPVSYLTPMSNDDYSLGSCTQKNNDQDGIRPACWFYESID